MGNALERTLEPGRVSVASRVARGDVAVHGRIAEAPDELAGTEVHVAVVSAHDAMTARLQLICDRARHRRLDFKIEAVHEFPAWPVARGLRLLACEQHARERLH